MTNQAKAMYALAVILSHIEAAGTRINHLVRRVLSPPRPRSADTCPLCGHQLGAPDQRPPRDTRTTRGKLKRLPAELLSWRRCGGCALHQVGT